MLPPRRSKDGIALERDTSELLSIPMWLSFGSPNSEFCHTSNSTATKGEALASGNPRWDWFRPTPMLLVKKNAMPSAFAEHPDPKPVMEKLVEKEPELTEKRGRGVLKKAALESCARK